MFAMKLGKMLLAVALVAGIEAGVAVRYVSHRGEWNDAPEGSAAAYRLAAERGLDLVKMDVQETKDGEIVMSHDDSFRRTAGVEGRIRDMTLAEIREKVVYKARGGFESERPVTFAEALKIIKDVPEIWIDFKAYNPAFAEKVFRTAAANGFDDSRIMVATYNVGALMWVKQNRPQVRRVMHMNIREPEPGKWTVSFTRDERHASLAAIEQLILNLKSKYGLYGINTDEDPARIDAGFIRRMHAAGLWVAIWYGNQTKASDYYLDNGCDAIVTACKRKHARQSEPRHQDNARSEKGMPCDGKGRGSK